MKHAQDLSELLLLQMFTNSRGTISLKNRSVRRHEMNQMDTDATYIPVFRRWRLISLIDSSSADNCAIASSCLINSCKHNDTMQRPIVNIYSYSISPWKIEMGKERERERVTYPKKELVWFNVKYNITRERPFYLYWVEFTAFQTSTLNLLGRYNNV